MSHYRLTHGVAAASLFVVILATGCSPSGSLDGVWLLDKDASSDLDQWRGITMTIRVEPEGVFVKRHFNAGRYNRSDSTTYSIDGSTREVTREASAKWLDSVHLGVFIDDGTTETVSGQWITPDKSFVTTAALPLTTSTTVTTIEITTTYELSRGGNRLTVTQNRSTREEPVTFVFDRDNSAEVNA